MLSYLQYKISLLIMETSLNAHIFLRRLESNRWTMLTLTNARRRTHDYYCNKYYKITFACESEWLGLWVGSCIILCIPGICCTKILKIIKNFKFILRRCPSFFPKIKNWNFPKIFRIIWFLKLMNFGLNDRVE
jgi:hypothetical protein